MEDYRQFFGIMYVSDDIPEPVQEKVLKQAESIYDRHYAEAEKELNRVLGPAGLEIAMGMLIKKGE